MFVLLCVVVSLFWACPVNQSSLSWLDNDDLNVGAESNTKIRCVISVRSFFICSLNTPLIVHILFSFVNLSYGSVRLVQACLCDMKEFCIDTTEATVIITFAPQQGKL